MANITETYRKPLMSDETGKAISEKLGGNTSATEQHINISEQYRKAPMTDETAQEILSKIDGGGGGASALSELSDVNLTSPSDGQVLHYDGTEWINATPVAELPAVTSDDNGDVLTVVEGAWAKASAGGGGAFVVNVTYDNVNVVADKTFLELEAAEAAGKSIYANVSSDVNYWGGGYNYVPLNSHYNPDGTDKAFRFTAIETGDGYFNVLILEIKPNNVVYVDYYGVSK